MDVYTDLNGLRRSNLFVNWAHEPYLMYSIYDHDTGNPVALAAVRAENHGDNKSSFQEIMLLMVHDPSTVQRVKLKSELRAPVAGMFRSEEDYINALMNHSRNELQYGPAQRLMPEITDWVAISDPEKAKAAYRLIQSVHLREPGQFEALDKGLVTLTSGEQVRLADQFAAIMSNNIANIPAIGSTAA